MHATKPAPVNPTLAVERPRIVIQGYPGAFHEIAARYFSAPIVPEIVPCDTFARLVKMVEAGEDCDYGLMAIENTLAGSLIGNYKLLTSSKLRVVGEVFLRIKQNLMVLPGGKVEDLTEVHSHPIAVAQCLEYFADFPHIKLVDATDTALSARIISEQKTPHIGAIASELAAELYGLEIIAPEIETNKKNFTRFLVVHSAERAEVIENANKVSLAVHVDHEVGSLHKVLAVLAAHNANLNKIQSVPIMGRDWEYEIFLDFVTEKPNTYMPILEAIEPLTHEMKLLGAYQTGKHYD
jgi:prephenate dehydratase